VSLGAVHEIFASHPGSSRSYVVHRATRNGELVCPIQLWGRCYELWIQDTPTMPGRRARHWRKLFAQSALSAAILSRVSTRLSLLRGLAFRNSSGSLAIFHRDLHASPQRPPRLDFSVAVGHSFTVNTTYFFGSEIGAQRMGHVPCTMRRPKLKLIRKFLASMFRMNY
jgi:hypothetical protein